MEQYGEIFTTCRNLETLSLFKLSPQKLAVTAARRILKSNKGLKKLVLDYSSSLFREDISNEISFKLREFEFYGLITKTAKLHNFNLFMMTQKDSLETLDITVKRNLKLLKIILSMPRLKKLTFQVFYRFKPKFVDQIIPKNYSLTYLNLMSYCEYSYNDDTVIEVLLKAFPNIQTLKLRTLTDQVAKLIPITCESLRSLRVYIFEAEFILDESFYSNLLEFNCEFLKNSLSCQLYLKIKPQEFIRSTLELNIEKRSKKIAAKIMDFKI